MKQKRNIIQIDETRCNGCRLCITACSERALTIINGKAKLVSDIYCDGLGNCLGECPQGAISIVEREADSFDEEAVKHHLAESDIFEETPCLASRMVNLTDNHPPIARKADRSEYFKLSNWPVQLMLIPVSAPYLAGSDIVISADCVPFAYAEFHEHIVRGKPLIIGCPKLDNKSFYVDKLTKVFESNTIRSVHIAFMEVPCCSGLVHIVQTALRNSHKNIPVTFSRISIDGVNTSELNDRTFEALPIL
ncbi:MAG: 4Fe-4S binding protein [Syntrophaceae bacterium]|nr:4Fe-4S binding protein [Syntrophaceae bacterium]